MKFLHIMNQSNIPVSKSFMKFMDEEFGNIDHDFAILTGGKAKEEFGVYNRININFYSDALGVLKGVGKYEKIFLHAMCISRVERLYLMSHPRVLKTVYWIAWGIDLYEYQEHGTIKRELKTLFETSFRRRIKNFIGIFPPDIDYFKQHIKSKARTYYGPYMLQLYSGLLSADIKKEKGDENTNIIIGHSATPALNHKQVLETLLKYKNENIKLYIPLSYGNRGYGDEVEKYAFKLFGDKAVCIREYMPYNEYLQLLCKMDIVIFNTQRQIGLGNIIVYFYLEKKIYMPKDSVMYQHFCKRGVPILKCEDIEFIEFSEFIENIDMQTGKKLALDEYFNRNFFVDIWSKIFMA